MSKLYKFESYPDYVTASKGETISYDTISAESSKERDDQFKAYYMIPIDNEEKYEDFLKQYPKGHVVICPSLECMNDTDTSETETLTFQYQRRKWIIKVKRDDKFCEAKRLLITNAQDFIGKNIIFTQKSKIIREEIPISSVLTNEPIYIGILPEESNRNHISERLRSQESGENVILHMTFEGGKKFSIEANKNQSWAEIMANDEILKLAGDRQVRFYQGSRTLPRNVKIGDFRSEESDPIMISVVSEQVNQEYRDYNRRPDLRDKSSNLLTGGVHGGYSIFSTMY